MPVEKLLHYFLGCIVLFHQMLSVEIPVFSQLATDAAIHNLLKKNSIVNHEKQPTVKYIKGKRDV